MCDVFKWVYQIQRIRCGSLLINVHCCVVFFKNTNGSFNASLVIIRRIRREQAPAEERLQAHVMLTSRSNSNRCEGIFSTVFFKPWRGKLRIFIIITMFFIKEII